MFIIGAGVWVDRIVLRPWWVFFGPLPGMLVGLLKTLNDPLMLKRRQPAENGCDDVTETIILVI
jgi:hypothetical protein